MPAVDYDYGGNIKQPSDMDMGSGSSMNTIGDNIAGILSYITLLVSGGGNASRTPGPMGPKFFIETPTTCKDVSDGQTKTRSIYLNYVPTGTLPGSFGMPNVPGVSTSYKGLLPGILSNIEQINPVTVMNKIMNDTGNSCRKLTMETIDATNTVSEGWGYVADNDIRRMSDDWFSLPNHPRPYIPPVKPENFENYGYNQNQDVIGSVTDVNFKKVDICKNIYINLLGLIGIYIMLKIMLGGRAH